MAIQAVTKQAICGASSHGAFTGTGNLKGNFALSICDRPKHSGNEHSDSETGKTWRS